MAGIVVVFDFDKTIVDCDSDNWVVDELGFNELFNRLLPTMPWNTLMDKMMMELHSHGKTIEDIVQVLQRIPIHPRIIHAIKAAHALGCDLRMVSDANTFFIETILRHLGIRECFSEINTNRDKMMNELHSQGKTIEDIVQVLNRTPMHPSIVPAIKASYSLGCELKIVSDANIFFIETILKHHGVWNCFSEVIANPSYGMIIERIQNSVDAAGKKFIYLGDGSVNFCPSLKLKDRDYLMPRKNFPLCDLVSENSNLIKAEVHAWRDGEELYDVLLHFINKAIGEGNGSISSSTPIISVDCKLEFN
ncbi:Inorganic pyrophosphatase 2 [Glycine max]|nr:Inorganic pyrophosphatase 2 [Glycine max]